MVFLALAWEAGFGHLPTLFLFFALLHTLCFLFSRQGVALIGWRHFHLHLTLRQHLLGGAKEGVFAKTAFFDTTFLLLFFSFFGLIFLFIFWSSGLARAEVGVHWGCILSGGDGERADDEWMGRLGANGQTE
jgi:hypothetical protein